MDVTSAQLSDWSGWTFAAVTGLWVVVAFLRGWIVSKSVLEVFKEAAKRSQDANDENSAAIRELVELGNTSVTLLKSLKTTEKGRR